MAKPYDAGGESGPQPAASGGRSRGRPKKPGKETIGIRLGRERAAATALRLVERSEITEGEHLRRLINTGLVIEVARQASFRALPEEISEELAAVEIGMILAQCLPFLRRHGVLERLGLGAPATTQQPVVSDDALTTRERFAEIDGSASADVSAIGGDDFI